jgi:hypothetical protein
MHGFLKIRGLLLLVLVPLSLLLVCSAGCVEEQPKNLSECIGASLTAPIPRTDAVLVARSDPDIVERVRGEDYKFRISVAEGSSPEAREEAFREVYLVQIDRYSLTTGEQAAGLLVTVTYDGHVGPTLWMPPARGPYTKPPENMSAAGVPGGGSLPAA